MRFVVVSSLQKNVFKKLFYGQWIEVSLFSTYRYWLWKLEMVQEAIRVDIYLSQSLTNWKEITFRLFTTIYELLSIWVTLSSKKSEELQCNFETWTIYNTLVTSKTNYFVICEVRSKTKPTFDCGYFLLVCFFFWHLTVMNVVATFHL